MTTIIQLREIIDTVRNLPNKKDKLNYLNQQSRSILNFLSGNIKKDGIAKAIASEIPISIVTVDTMEQIVIVFHNASRLTGKLDKIDEMKQIILSSKDREFILTTLYGSLKLGVTIPIPEPKFGDIIKPQLCGTGIEFDSKKYIIEQKFDGIRCVATNNNGEITLQSRNGKVLNVPVIERFLKNILPTGTTVDGEIIASDGQFESLDRKSNNLVYMIFDIIYYDNVSTINYSLSYRRDFINRYIIENDHVKISQTLNLNTMDEINEWVDNTGAEGIVAKNPNSLYQYGNRKDWIKYKLFKECTAKVIGYTLGEGRRKDTIGSINIIPEKSNVISKCGSGFSDEDLDYMKELIDSGKNILVNIKYQNLTNGGCLRFPIFLQIRSFDDKESLEW